MAKGAVWMVSMRWVLRLIGLLNTVVIARLLTPEDFGIVAMALVIYAFLEVLAEVDIDNLLIRKKNPTKDDYNTVWTAKIILGWLVAGFLVAVSPLAAWYFEDDRVVLVIFIIALRPAIIGFENVGIVDFRRQLNFAKEFRYWVFRRLVTFVFALGLVIIFRNFYALACAGPIAGLVMVAASFIMAPYRPWFSLKSIGEIRDFSVWLISFDFARAVSWRADEFIVGGTASTTVMGHYHVGSDFAMLPTREVTYPLGRALTPTYSKISHDGAELRKAFRRVVEYIAILCAAIGIGLFAVAEDLILTVLGEQWRQAVPFFEWIALYGAVEGMIICHFSLFIVMHRERLQTVLAVGHVLVLVPALIVAANLSGIEAVAMTRFYVMVAFAIVVYAAISHISDFTFTDLFSAVWRPLTAGVFMGWAVVSFSLTEDAIQIFSLAADIAIGAFLFPLVLGGLWLLSGCPDGAEAATIRAIKNRLAKQSS